MLDLRGCPNVRWRSGVRAESTRPVRPAGRAEHRRGARLRRAGHRDRHPGRAAGGLARRPAGPAHAAHPVRRLDAARGADQGAPGGGHRRWTDRLRGGLHGGRDGAGGRPGQRRAARDAALGRRAGRHPGHRGTPRRRRPAAARPVGHAGGAPAGRLAAAAGQRRDGAGRRRRRRRRGTARRRVAGRHAGRPDRRRALRRDAAGYRAWTAWSRRARWPGGRTARYGTARPAGSASGSARWSRARALPARCSPATGRCHRSRCSPASGPTRTGCASRSAAGSTDTAEVVLTELRPRPAGHRPGGRGGQLPAARAGWPG